MKTDYTSSLSLLDGPVEVQLQTPLDALPGTGSLSIAGWGNGYVRYQRIGFAQADMGVAWWASHFSPNNVETALGALLRIQSLAAPQTFYRVDVNPGYLFVAAYRVVAGIETLLSIVYPADWYGVIEYRVLLVGAELQVEHRVVPIVPWTLDISIVDPAPIVGVGGVGFEFPSRPYGGVGISDNLRFTDAA